MSRKYLKIYVTSIFYAGILLFPFYSCPEIIKLNDGAVVEGEIIKEDSQYFWVMFDLGSGKGETKVRKSEIKSVERSQKDTFSGNDYFSKDIPNPLIVRDKKYGFHIELYSDYLAVSLDSSGNRRFEAAKDNSIDLSFRVLGPGDKKKLDDAFNYKSDPFNLGGREPLEKAKTSNNRFDIYLAVYENEPGILSARYVLIPRNYGRQNFAADIVFVYPKKDDLAMCRKITAMVSSAAIDGQEALNFTGERALNVKNIFASLFYIFIAVVAGFLLLRKKNIKK